MVTPEFNENSGVLRISMTDGNGNSPLNSTSTFGFKAVLIKANGLKTHPNIDLSNYEDISKTFNLK